MNKNSAYKLAQKSLRFIQESKIDSLKDLVNRKVLKMVKPEQMDWVMENGKIVLDNYKYPNDTSVLQSKRINYSMGGKQEIIMYSFPFQSEAHKDSVKYFHITVVNDEIHRILLSNYPPGMRIIETKD